MIRAPTARDVEGLKAIIAATDLFPASLLDDMIAGFLAGADEDIWLMDGDKRPVAMAYVAPERMTHGTWNLLLIAVGPDDQGRGRGTALIAQVERVVADRGARLLLAETSGLPEFARTRSFYRRCGFDETACIPGFYQAGEDKIIFLKALR